MADIKRVNYFTHQFLVEKDFDDEQAYHIDMRHRHNRVNHSWGVADGLDAGKKGDKEITISSGTAIDKDGREIVLLESASLDLTAFGADTDVYLVIAYQEIFDAADHYTSGGVDNYTRTTERPNLSVKKSVADDGSESVADDGSVIKLACVTLDSHGNINGIDNTVRTLVGSKIAAGTVDTNELANNSVTNAKLANNSVNAAKIADGGVSTAELANGSVTNAKLANNSVNAAKIADGSVSTAELANGSVTNAKLANNSVNAAKIADGSVSTAELANGSVTNAKLANNSVNAAKIADGSVSTAELANGSVTNAKLANNSVNAAKIVNGSVSTAELANNTVPLSKIKKTTPYNLTSSVNANATHAFSLSEYDDEHAFYLVSVYCITANARITWEWDMARYDARGIIYYTRRVIVRNLTNITASFQLKIYRLLEN